MDYLKELSRLQAENQKYDEVIEKAAKDLGEALLTIAEENQLDDGICGFAEPCIEDLCDASYAKGYNDCLIKMAKHGAANEPVIFPND